jgi:muramoyltetrapeptide carboxypeptidase
MLATLEVGGHLARAAAFLVGDFHACGPGPDGVTIDDVLREHLGRLGVPVVAGAPVGHGPRNEPVVLGGHARLDATTPRGRVTLRASAGCP